MLSHEFFPLSKLGELAYDPKLNRWGKLVDVYYGSYGEYDRDRDIDPPQVYVYLVCFPYPNFERHRKTGRLRRTWGSYPAWEIVKSESNIAPDEIKKLLDEFPIRRENYCSLLRK